MYKFIFLTFAFLAWAFFELSGGQDFEPMAPQAAAESTEDEAVQVASLTTVVPGETTTDADPAPADLPAVTRVSFSQPNFDLRRPNKDEIAAVDPAVLASFGSVLNDKPMATVQNAVVTPEEEVVEDIRKVAGNRVNMRNGPGTNYSIVARLTRGEEVEVLSEPGNGWLKLRVSESGRIGWMADFLVTSAE